MLVSVYSHTQHTVLRSFVTLKLVSTPIMGYHQAIIQENECLQKLQYHKVGISPFYIKNTFRMYAKCMKV